MSDLISSSGRRTMTTPRVGDIYISRKEWVERTGDVNPVYESAAEVEAVSPGGMVMLREEQIGILLRMTVAALHRGYMRLEVVR